MARIPEVKIQSMLSLKRILFPDEPEIFSRKTQCHHAPGDSLAIVLNPHQSVNARSRNRQRDTSIPKKSEPFVSVLVTLDHNKNYAEEDMKARKKVRHLVTGHTESLGSIGVTPDRPIVTKKVKRKQTGAENTLASITAPKRAAKKATTRNRESKSKTARGEMVRKQGKVSKRAQICLTKSCQNSETQNNTAYPKVLVDSLLGKFTLQEKATHPKDSAIEENGHQSKRDAVSRRRKIRRACTKERGKTYRALSRPLNYGGLGAFADKTNVLQQTAEKAFEVTSKQKKNSKQQQTQPQRKVRRLVSPIPSALCIESMALKTEQETIQQAEMHAKQKNLSDAVPQELEPSDAELICNDLEKENHHTSENHCSLEEDVKSQASRAETKGRTSNDTLSLETSAVQEASCQDDKLSDCDENCTREHHNSEKKKKSKKKSKEKSKKKSKRRPLVRCDGREVDETTTREDTTAPKSEKRNPVRRSERLSGQISTIASQSCDSSIDTETQMEPRTVPKIEPQTEIVEVGQGLRRSNRSRKCPDRHGVYADENGVCGTKISSEAETPKESIRQTSTEESKRQASQRHQNSRSVKKELARAELSENFLPENLEDDIFNATPMRGLLLSGDCSNNTVTSSGFENNSKLNFGIAIKETPVKSPRMVPNSKSSTKEVEVDRGVRRSKRSRKCPDRHGVYADAKGMTEILCPAKVPPEDSKHRSQKRQRRSGVEETEIKDGSSDGAEQIETKDGSNDKECQDLQGSEPDRTFWSDIEVRLLRGAHKEVNPKSVSFWEDIAEMVEGRSSVECREKWFSLVKTPVIPTRKPTKRINQSFIPELSDDDIFNATPMRGLILTQDDGNSTNTPTDFGNFPNFNFGSAIKVSHTTDEISNGTGGQNLRGYKTYIESMRRGVNNSSKQRLPKAMMGKAMKNLSERAGQGDVEIKCRLSPGGTLQVKTNSETDASMDLDDDDDHDHLYSH